MKKQKSNTPFKALFPLICLISFFLQRVFLCSALLWVLTVTISQAQNLNLIEVSLQQVEYLEAKPQTFKIPSNTGAKYLFLRAEGADGGKRYNDELNIEFAKGGEGATMKAWFPIGTGENEVPPGSDVRMIIGYQGASQKAVYVIGAGGGGGTGVLFRRPGASIWNLLIVAGGGGGGAGSAVSWYYGIPGNIYPPGTMDGGIGGTDGEGGAHGDGQSDDAGFGGAGIYSRGDGGYGGYPGWSTDPTVDPEGGYGGSHEHIDFDYWISGGWGFGGGGSGKKGGGGGGGYSGGGGGSYDSGSDKGLSGGGGGSYINKDFAIPGSILRIKNGSTDSPGSGFVEYQLLSDLPDHTIKLTSAPQKCIDVEKDIDQNGNNVRLKDCSLFIENQSWQFDGSKINLTNNSQKCLDVENHQTANGTNVRIWDCMNHNEQKWIYDGLTQQFRSFLNLNKCLNDAYGGRTDNGTNIMLWDCNNGGGKADQWNVKGAVTISNPTEVKNIIPVKASGLALQSASGAQSGSNVQLGTKNTNDSSERWVFDGRQIKYSPSRDLCLTVKAGDTSNGTNILLRGCSDSDAKKWVYNGMTQQIRSAANPDKCLEVATSGGVFEKGMNIQLMDCNQHSRQKFDLK